MVNIRKCGWNCTCFVLVQLVVTWEFLDWDGILVNTWSWDLFALNKCFFALI